MERLRHHLRPLAVALATLALSAGVVLAAKPAMPAAAQDGLDRAAEAAGKPVPVVAVPEAQPVPTETDEDVEELGQEPEEPAEDPADDADTPCELLPEGRE